MAIVSCPSQNEGFSTSGPLVGGAVWTGITICSCATSLPMRASSAPSADTEDSHVVEGLPACGAYCDGDS